MKVKELIEMLQKEDPEMEAVTRDSSFGYNPVSECSVIVDKAWIMSFNPIKYDKPKPELLID